MSAKSVLSALREMEDDLSDLVRYGNLIDALSYSSDMLDPDALRIIGRPLRQLGERLDAHWKAAFIAAGGQL